MVGQQQQQQQVQPQPQQAGQVAPVHSAVEQQPQVVHQQMGPAVGGQQHYYAPAGMIQPVGVQQYGAGAEQYGKPEPASMPPNYKPFGSWGLYIGGNPADGYYTNYYKALGSSVDKQQMSGGGVSSVEPAAGGKPQVVSNVVGSSGSGAIGPMYKQAISSSGGSYADQVYPFDYYTPADLNGGSRVALVEQQMGAGPSVYSAGIPSSSSSSSGMASPMQIGSQVYGYSHSANIGSQVEQPPMSMSYAAAPDHYATKRMGASGSKSGDSGAQAKGYSQARYMYSPAQQHHMHQQQQYQQHYSNGQPAQMVAYPVPVGSQMVGSQPGTEGAYAPYGVHGYTRYAVKPTMVSAGEQHYHSGVHSAPVAHFPAYKQQQVGGQQQVVQPMNFYGYPMNQLHYSQGSIVPAFGPQGSSSVSSSVVPSSQVSPVSSSGAGVGTQQHGVGMHSSAVVGDQHQVGAGPVGMSPVGVQFEAAGSEKSETQATASGTESKPKEQIKA